MKLAVLALLCSEAASLELRHRANPIRKVVTMLQLMQKKVEAEGEKEKELHEKYLCYCNSGAGALEKSIDEYETRIPTLQATIKDGTSKLSQLKTEVEGHKADRTDAKKAMGSATGVRERDAAAFKTLREESQTEISQMERAISALKKGLGGAFLQTAAAASLKQLVLAKDNMDAGDRDEVLSFLSGEDSSPGTSEIVGILKEMLDGTSKDLADATAVETSAIKTYEGLMAAKTKEVEAATKMIEVKLVRIGDLEVDIATSKNDLGDVEDALEDDKKFLLDLKKNCGKAAELYEDNVKMRTEEIAALADTIKILNDDDALELFKKTLPGPEKSFLQLAESMSEVRSRALQALRSARPHAGHAVPIDFIAVALEGKKVGFDKVIGMVDKLVAELKKEQTVDDEKNEYCATEFDKADDKKKVLEKEISDLNTNIDDAKEAIAKLSEEVKGLEDGIKALDQQVAEATEQRKEEAAEFTDRQASDGAAKQLLEYAKNRLNKFYNPKLYKAPSELQLSYKKKGEESQGVIEMINILISDLEKDMTEAEVTEKDAQADYEAMLKDASEKRVVDSKALEEKEDARTQTIAAVEEYDGALHIGKKTLEAVQKSISNLHGECDFLLKYFDVRKEARDNEIGALNKAKAVLSGADFS